MKKQLLILFLFGITKIYTQGFVANSPNTLYPVNSTLGLTPINVCIGHNTPVANRVFHTLGQIRFAGLTNDNSLTRVLVTDANGDVKWRDASSLSGGLAWLLGGNTNTTTANNILGTLNTLDIRIFTNNFQRARYLADGNYELGTTNNFGGSLICFQGGDINTTTSDTNLFTYGRLNNTMTSRNSCAIGDHNTISNSQSVMAFGENNLVSNSDQGGVIGEDLRMLNSHGSFMAGGHSTINLQNNKGYNWTIGNRNTITGTFNFPTPTSHNSILGAHDNIENSTFSHIHGNGANITSSTRSFIYGDGNTITNGDNTYILGSGITNEQINSAKFGFNSNRTMTITQRGIDIQMDPTNPNPTAPNHNLEVMAGSGGIPASNPEIQFKNLPYTTQDMDMVVIDPISDELYRIPNCCKSGGGIANTCTTTGNVPRVDGSGSGNLECSQIHDAGIGFGVGIGTTSPRSFTGAGIAIFGPPPIATISHLDVDGLTFTNTLVVSSDARLKKDVMPIDNALEKALKLNGVTYSWDIDKHKERNLDHLPQAGFLAQEVEKVFPTAVVKDNEGFYAMNYNAIIPLVIQAIKELNAKVESQNSLQKENEVLKSEISSLKEKYELIEKTIAILCESGCQGLKSNSEDRDILYQSIPNPTDDIAMINYYLANSYSNVYISLLSTDGKLIQSHKIPTSLGKGSLKLSLGNLPSQTYTYTLVADERILDSKKMQIIK